MRNFPLTSKQRNEVFNFYCLYKFWFYSFLWTFLQLFQKIEISIKFCNFVSHLSNKIFTLSPILETFKQNAPEKNGSKRQLPFIMGIRYLFLYHFSLDILHFSIKAKITLRKCIFVQYSICTGYINCTYI
jgi:hypothetical protein